MLEGVIANMVVAIELIQKVDRADVEEEVRPHRQHHVRLGEDADRRARPVVRRARGTDGVPLPASRGRSRRTNVTINFLLPGSFDTDRLNHNMETVAKNQNITVEQARAARAASVPAKRFGYPDEFGAACAFLCSAHAGYITGQNMLIDGGVFPGAF